MTERERLIEILRQGYEKKINLLEFEKEILADWLLENGVILPPVKIKIGDVLYVNYWDDEITPMVEALKVTEVSNKRIWVDDGISIEVTDIGKTVFLTRKDAEKALNEQKK